MATWSLAGRHAGPDKPPTPVLCSRQSPPQCAFLFSEEFTGDAAAFFQACADHQLEGIVSKLASSKYRSGRSKTWLKTKCFTESSFLIIGTARDRKTKAALLGRRQFNWLLASAPSPPIAFNAADKTLTVVVDFDQRLMTLFAVTRQHAPAQRASGANGVPNT